MVRKVPLQEGSGASSSFDRCPKALEGAKLKIYVHWPQPRAEIPARNSEGRLGYLEGPRLPLAGSWLNSRFNFRFNVLGQCVSCSDRHNV